MHFIIIISAVLASLDILINAFQVRTFYLSYLFSVCWEVLYNSFCISTFPTSVASMAIQHNSAKALPMKQTLDANAVPIQFQQ